jgi:hypothetical protein
MIRHLWLAAFCLCACLSTADEKESEETVQENKGSSWRKLGQKGWDNLKQVSGTSKSFLLAKYRFLHRSGYTGEFYCNTNNVLTGHKFVTGTACEISYTFVANNIYQEFKLEGNFLDFQTTETCEEAEKICRQTKLDLKEEGNQLHILSNDKLVARIIYINDMPGFLPEAK